MDIFKSILSNVFERLDKLLIAGGIIFILLAKTTFNASWLPQFPSPFDWTLGIIGFSMLVAGIIVYFTVERGITINIRNVSKKGIEFIFGSLKLLIKAGRIEDCSCDNYSAMILPVNTSFVDDCRTDSNSVMGAIILKYYPSKIDAIQKDIIKQLIDTGILPSSECYPAGTTILMPEIYNKPCHLILTATTIKKPIEGIRTSPDIVSKCIQNIFQITADKKISKLYFPVLGSGHGGLAVFDSLITMLITIKFLSGKYHHIKNIDVIFLIENLKGIIKNLKILKLYR